MQKMCLMMIALNIIIIQTGETALHRASNNGHVEVVNILLRNGANISATATNVSTIITN